MGDRGQRAAAGLPRTRGDGPGANGGLGWTASASPHTRGWTAVPAVRRGQGRGFPAHAGMDRRRCRAAARRRRLPRTRGDGPRGDAEPRLSDLASPHTRGWTQDGRRGGDSATGFPAHAGMDRPSRWRGRSSVWLPRTRGDGPSSWRRIESLTSASRTRGDGPDTRAHGALLVRASPHTRGWTHVGPDLRVDAVGFPAHAGMDPTEIERSAG